MKTTFREYYVLVYLLDVVIGDFNGWKTITIPIDIKEEKNINDEIYNLTVTYVGTTKTW